MMVSGASGIISYLGQNKVLVAKENAMHELSPGEEQLKSDLQRRDQEVKAHELAHLQAAGDLAVSGPKYNYQIGPDGKAYAIGGEVSLALKPVAGNPEATLAAARRMRSAALAANDPSAADLAAASVAGQIEKETQAQKSGMKLDVYA